MKTLFEAIVKALSRGEDAVLCSIIASSGSTPRGKGAKMAVFEDGSTLGTVGGGAVEYHSILTAKEALREKTGFSKGFDLSPNQTADIGMICGGKVVVYFQFFSGKDEPERKKLEHIVSLLDKNEDAWLITLVSEGRQVGLGVYEEKEGLKYVDLPLEDVRPLLKSSGVLQKQEPSFYVEPLVQSGYVYVFGGGHVAQELVPVLAHVGFRPVVYEDREMFAAAELFPKAAAKIVGPFTDIFKKIAITRKDYVAIMTRGHQADYQVLEQVMRTDACYIGMIGSKHKIASTFKRLVEAGIDEAELSRIHSPIGLPIQGETPAEIAISIAAEMILKRAELAKHYF